MYQKIDQVTQNGQRDEWYGLKQPLPDGSKRKRDRNEVGETDNAEQRKSKEELEKEKKRLARILSQLPPLPPHVTAKFDGACRGNGSANARSSAGVYCMGYDCPLTRGEVLGVKTNNAAEIESCRLACFTITEVLPAFKERNVTRVTIAGDSAQVIATVTNGTLFAYKKRSGLVNSDNWCALSEAVRLLFAVASELDIEIVFTWIPRAHNAEADEMANAALDERAPDRNVRSVLGSSIDVEVGVARIIAAMPFHRTRTFRTLPESLSKHFSILVHDIFSRYEHRLARRLFIVLPLLVSSSVSSMRNKEEYKRVLVHLTLLANRSYLQQTLVDALVLLGVPNELGTPVSAEKRANTLCARGLHAKVIKDSAVSGIADATDPIVQRQLADLFPQDRLPPALEVVQPVLINFGDIRRAIQKTKRGTAPGLSGWTRELLFGLIVEPSDKIREGLVAVFASIINGAIDEDEVDLLTSGILIPFKYANKPKPRPVSILDLLMRTAVKIALAECDMPTSFINQTIATLRKLQDLADEEACIVADGSNAFGTVKRRPAMLFFDSRREKFSPFIPLLNMLYARKSVCRVYDARGVVIFEVKLTKGTRQGCPSGSAYFRAAIDECVREVQKRIAPNKLEVFADDCNFRGRLAPLSGLSVIEAADIGADLLREQCDLDITGPKVAVISAAGGSRLVFGRQIVVVTAHRNLGGIIACRNPLRRELHAACDEVWARAKRRVNALLELNISTQNRIIILRLFARFLIYFVATHPIHHDIVKELWVSIDELHQTAFERIVGLTVPPIHAPTIFTPIESGGAGLLPLHWLSMRLGTVLSTEWDSFYSDVKRELALWPTTCFNQPQNCCWNSWPTTRMSSISDEVYKTYWGMRFEMLRKPNRAVCQSVKNHPGSFSRHLSTCEACCPAMKMLRHNLATNAIVTTLNYNMIYARLITHQPLPGNERGGADFEVYTQNTREECDTSVVTEDFQNPHRGARMAIAHATKISTYREYSKIVTHEVHPIIMNTFGAFHPKTLERFAFWANTRPSGKQLEARLVAHTQIAMLRGVTSSISQFYAAFDMTIAQALQ